MLAVRNLAVWYPRRTGVFARIRGYVKAVDGVSFAMKAGETLGVIGESGCGKSTLVRAILGLVKPTAGEILFDGAAPGRDIYRKIQVVFQDPQASLNPRHSVLDILTEAPVVHGMIARSDRRKVAESLLADVGLLPDILERFPHEFSGGQRQRICIARALALKPRLLICDEAVSALDLSVRAQVLNLLGDLKARHGLSYLFITHDIGVVEHFADRLLVMNAGRIVEEGTPAQVAGSPREAYTRRLIEAVPRIREEICYE